MHCIIIFYNPPTNIVKRWERFIKEHPRFSFVIVDNSAKSNWSADLNNCFYIPLYENSGIASAQNEGIKCAIKDGAKYVIFFDQDSEVDGTYCDSMVSEYERIKNLEPALAMLGPTVVNKETMANYKTSSVANERGYSLSNCLISSGTIVESNIFKVVGMMEDKLFIDAVDFEWCWRASSKGYACARTERVKLPHKVGQKNINLFGMPFIVSSPFRYYYQYRNWLWLLRRSYVPTKWKLKTSVRRFFELFIIPLLTDQKYSTIINMMRGIWVGIIKRKNEEINSIRY